MMFIAVIVATNSFCFGQVTSIEKNKEDGVKPVAIEKSRTSVVSSESGSKPFTISKRAGEDQITHNQNYYLQEIEKINQNLIAIEKKSEFINNSPEEKELAENNGWFQQMEQIKIQLLEKRTMLQDKMNNKN